MDKRIKIIIKSLLSDCEKSLKLSLVAYHSKMDAARVQVYVSEAYTCIKVLHLIEAMYDDEELDELDDFIKEFSIIHNELLENIAHNSSISSSLVEFNELKETCKVLKEKF